MKTYFKFICTRIFRISKITPFVTLFIAYFLLSASASANNIYIQNVTYTAATKTVNFQLSWENSWFTNAGPTNWDAAWIFIKYQPCGSGIPASPEWEHADISSTPADHSISCATACAPFSMQVDLVTDNKGVFIRGNALASGFTNLWNVSLKVAGTAATTCVTATDCNWKVFGVEMVQIPGAASFNVGDGSGTTTNPFNDALGTPGNPYNITSAGAIGAGALYAGSPAVAANYPKGYDAFYSMKHEISQEEYAGFLNTLSYDQQATRVLTSPDTIYNMWALTTPTGGPYNRQGIIATSQGIDNFQPAAYGNDLNNDFVPNGTTDGLHIAANYLRWQDVAAFLDWAALRPLTELEYEKVCRGTIASVADEYPWGNSTEVTSGTNTMLTNAGEVSERIDTLSACPGIPIGWCNGLAIYNGVAGQGPVRIGQSARNATTRAQAGGGYYGALDLAGNVWEQIVSVSTQSCVTIPFTGSYGDGALSTAGNATNADWPGVTAGEVTGASGSGARGASWFTQAANVKQLRTSDRTNATNATSVRDAEYGGRGGR